MAASLINEGVFEPGYNDLKLTIWNRNFFFNKLNTSKRGDWRRLEETN